MKKIINVVKESATMAAERVMSSPFGLAVRNVLCAELTPVDFLKKLPWERLIPVGENISQEEFCKMNKEFDPRGCVGRITLAMYLLEGCFPETSFKVGEVVVDDLAQRMKTAIKKHSDSQIRHEMASELLMYEDPHAVLVIDGVQFDPLVRFISDLKHPGVNVFDQEPWQVIVAFLLTSEALSEDDLQVRAELLRQAETFCPTRNIAQSYLACKVGLETVTREDFEIFLADGHNARAEYQMLRIFGDERIFDHYPREVVEILDQEMELKMGTLLEGGNNVG